MKLYLFPFPSVFHGRVIVPKTGIRSVIMYRLLSSGLMRLLVIVESNVDAGLSETFNDKKFLSKIRVATNWVPWACNLSSGDPKKTTGELRPKAVDLISRWAPRARYTSMTAYPVGRPVIRNIPEARKCDATASAIWSISMMPTSKWPADAHPRPHSATSSQWSKTSSGPASTNGARTLWAKIIVIPIVRLPGILDGRGKGKFQQAKSKSDERIGGGGCGSNIYSACFMTSQSPAFFQMTGPSCACNSFAWSSSKHVKTKAQGIGTVLPASEELNLTGCRATSQPTKVCLDKAGC